MAVSDDLIIHYENKAWWILDPKGWAEFKPSKEHVAKFGPYQTKEEAERKRELLYARIYGDFI